MKKNNKIHHQIDETACKGCGLCVAQCPKQALEITRKRNAKGYLVPGPKSPCPCIGCRLCEMICPDLAIYIEQKEE